jgi:TolB-like protein
MAVQSSTPKPGQTSDPRLAEQLGRILASKAFRQSDRLKRFLTFIVEETIAGRGEGLKEYIVGVEVFGKPDTFDPRNDPIVRVQARRLRSHLAQYYGGEGQDDPLVIELPKGGYAPAIRPLKNAPPKRHSSPLLVSRNTVLVLPFADHSGAGDQRYFCEGIRDEIVHTLAGLGSIRLVAREARDDERSGQNLQEDYIQSHAATIVTGSVRVSGHEARITTNVVDAATGIYIWSGSINRTMENIFAIQEEVARAIADQLTAQPEGAWKSRASGRATANLAAYNLYVQGRYHLNQRTEEGLRRAAEFFDKAIAEDEQYAQAYSGLADAYSLLGHYGVLAPAEVWTKTASNAAWAVRLDEDSAEPHTSLAHVKATQDWDWLGAEHEFKRAIGLDPRYPTAHHWYSVSCLTPMGRMEQALEEIQLAYALDPISSIIARDLARVYYYLQDYDAALDQCDRTIELNPHFAPAYWILGLVQEQRGELDESAAAFQRALQLSPRSPSIQAALGRTFALSGKREEALRILADLHKLAERRYVPPFDLAGCYFALEMPDKGFEWLAKAFQDRCFDLISLRVDPRWQSLRADARFKELLDCLKLPETIDG